VRQHREIAFSAGSSSIMTLPTGSSLARQRNNVLMCSFALKADGQREIVVHWKI